MCGIAGIAYDSMRSLDLRLLKAMADLIKHRGPDGEGYFSAPGIGLAHKRLAIVDIEGGSQPIVSEDGSVAIVYNGEVYNYLELKQSLVSKGHRFRTNCDSEVALNAYMEWGIDAIERFNGMFAFAIWDGRTSTLHLARDPIGIKPLYYYSDPRMIVFASEIKAIFPDPSVPRSVEPRTLIDFAAFQNVLDGKTFYKGIHKCLPGHRIVWRLGQMEVHKYWDVGTEAEESNLTFEEACGAYRDAISRSVKDHLMGEVKAGGYLSGGIDSSSVAAVAAGHQERFQTFTGYFGEGGRYDERAGASAVAERYKTLHHEVLINWKDYTEHFARICYHLDEPMLGSGSLPQYMVARQVGKSAKVVLTGHGGDEFFAGYPVFKSAIIKDRRTSLSFIARMLKGLQGEEMIRFLYFLGIGAFNRAVANGLFSMYGGRERKKIFTAGFLGGLKGYDPMESVDFVLGGGRLNDSQKVRRLYIKTYLSTLLVQEDKISMAHSVEARTPLLDKRIVNLSASIPAALKLHKCVLKAVPKAAMRDMLPPVLYGLPKRGFPTPIVEWYRGPLFKWTREMLLDGIPKPLEGIFNKKILEKDINTFKNFTGRLPSYSYALAHRYYSLCSLFSSLGQLLSIKAEAA